MQKSKPSKSNMRDLIAQQVQNLFGRSIEEANRGQIYEACAAVTRSYLTRSMVQTQKLAEKHVDKQVHYLCMEFLVGRSLRNNAYNLGILDEMTDAVKALGFEAADIFAEEDDPGLGNGGLGRLAACYMDSMATTGMHATGYTIRYENGIFKQGFVDGQQVELPDTWLETGGVWQMPAMDEIKEVKIGGHLNSYFDEAGQFVVEYHDYTSLLAVPYDMPISGYKTENTTKIRMWQAKSREPMDMRLFSSGEYVKSVEQRALAETISKILYPEDNHMEGHSLRLKQQYFLVSASIQDICEKHKKKYGTLKSFAEKNVLHINDTHPVLVIPELMRILMDENGMEWDEAWHIVSSCVAYTNHTVLPEALECWQVSLVRDLMPRVMQIIDEINRRFMEVLEARYPDNQQKRDTLAVVASGTVRMANLAIVGSFSVNGVSALHSDILKERVFEDYYAMFPNKFTNVTNGITFRRWLCEANPKLTTLISSAVGDDFIKHSSKINALESQKDNEAFLKELLRVKAENKQALADYILKENGITVNMDSIFDVQVKRLHEYKRQLLNVMHIISLYHDIRENPSAPFVPRTFVFGSKAAPGYVVAKKIVRLIHSVANMVNNDPVVGDKLKVVFIVDYKVSLAELIIPATEVSEQISTAGKEASGTGNMKFMLNGALTIGTMDGANVEICEAAGRENCFIFGMTAPEAQMLASSGAYHPMEIYDNNPQVRAVLDHMRSGFGDGVDYSDLVGMLLQGGGNTPADQYFLLRDFDDYKRAQRDVATAYQDKQHWARMSLMNIANAGRFSSDRAISDYAQNIWNVKCDFK